MNVIFTLVVIGCAVLMTGTVYLQTVKPVLVISGFCVYSVASALFMFPVLQNYYLKALEVSLKHAMQRGLASVFIVFYVGKSKVPLVLYLLYSMICSFTFEKNTINYLKFERSAIQ